MKKLSQIIKIVNPKDTIGFEEVEIDAIQYLADWLESKNMFCCISEFLEYGRWIECSDQVERLHGKKFAAIMANSPIPNIEVPQIIVDNPVQSMAKASRYFYDEPDKKQKIIGVTGTNGKTTITHIVSHVLNQTGMPAACMGTIGVFLKDRKKENAVYTTPLSPDIYKTLSNLVKDGVKAIAMEISSHALKLDRVYGFSPDIAVFSNLSRDHMDFHKTLDDYMSSKEKLFGMVKQNGAAIINADDPVGKRFIEQANTSTISYGLSKDVDFYAKNIRYYPDRTDMTLVFDGKESKLTTKLTGRFNVYNILAGAGACIGLGVPFADLKEPLMSFESVDGRMNIVPVAGSRIGIVDYAHTPDALKNVLETLRETTNHRVITVFGCGGDRDKGKRPLMGKTASELSDICIVTSDNPRTEDPNSIIDDILEGIEGLAPVVEPDRRKAIVKAFEISDKKDIILVAGKGHEDYQVIGDTKIHFSDKEELLALKQ